MKTLEYIGDPSPLISLWRECFKDDNENSPKEFYSSVRSTTLVAEEDGTIIGMANLLPVSINSLKGVYLYAACVSPKFRGKGVFRALLKACEQVCADFICLIPENEEVERTYRRHGYSVDVFRYGKSCDADAVPIFCEADFARFATPTSVAASDTAYSIGLLKPLRSKTFPKKMRFSFYMGEI